MDASTVMMTPINVKMPQFMPWPAANRTGRSTRRTRTATTVRKRGKRNGDENYFQLFE
jgi:hypothetical protein